MTTTYIPVARDVVIDIAAHTGRIQRQFLTCFRCGQPHHYKSECHNFRTRMCNAWMNEQCNELYCSFAHGEAELRTPWIPMCIRIARVDGRIRRFGCGMQGHTFRQCHMRHTFEPQMRRSTY